MKHKTFFPAAAMFAAVMLCCQFQTLNACAQNYQWAKGIDNASIDYIYSNVYIVSCCKDNIGSYKLPVIAIHNKI